MSATAVPAATKDRATFVANLSLFTMVASATWAVIVTSLLAATSTTGDGRGLLAFLGVLFLLGAAGTATSAHRRNKAARLVIDEN